MFKTIFGKIMVVFMVIIMISLYISGMMMSQMMRQSHEAESEAKLLATAEDISFYVRFYNKEYITYEELSTQIVGKIIDSHDPVWWVRGDQSLSQYYLTTNDPMQPDQILHYIEDMIDELNTGKPVTKIAEEKDDNNPFRAPVITVGYPITGGEDGTEFVFVNRSLSALNTQLANIYRQIVLSVAIAGILAIIITYIFTRYLLRPLDIVTMGAKQLARGHFDIWLEVRSEDEIGQLADTFNMLAQDLRKYERTKDSFIANVSHELRSPLTSMQGLIQGVIDGTIEQDEQLHYLGVVLDETKRMNSLVTNMLNLARMESGHFPLELEQIEVNELLRRSLITFESKIDVKNLMVEVEFENDHEFALADTNQIMQVVHNIIDNAIKFADYGGRLRLSTLSDNEHVIISINNSGEPIPRSDIPYLFDRFYKGDESHTRTAEGTGIGLSIVRKILEEHRQKIWVESDRMGGTTFTFTLEKSNPEND